MERNAILAKDNTNERVEVERLRSHVREVGKAFDGINFPRHVSTPGQKARYLAEEKKSEERSWSHVCRGIEKRLHSLGFGQYGQANTIAGMVRAASDELEKLRDQLTTARKALGEIGAKRIFKNADHTKAFRRIARAAIKKLSGANDG